MPALTSSQSFLLVNDVTTFIARTGLVGLSHARTPWRATLPVTGFVADGALCAPIVSTDFCAFTASTRNFRLLVAATRLPGTYGVNAGLCRIAATELVAAAYKEHSSS